MCYFQRDKHLHTLNQLINIFSVFYFSPIEFLLPLKIFTKTRELLRRRIVHGNGGLILSLKSIDCSEENRSNLQRRFVYKTCLENGAIVVENCRKQIAQDLSSCLNVLYPRSKSWLDQIRD